MPIRLTNFATHRCPRGVLSVNGFRLKPMLHPLIGDVELNSSEWYAVEPSIHLPTIPYSSPNVGEFLHYRFNVFFGDYNLRCSMGYLVYPPLFPSRILCQQLSFCFPRSLTLNAPPLPEVSASNVFRLAYIHLDELNLVVEGVLSAIKARLSDFP